MMIAPNTMHKIVISIILMLKMREDVSQLEYTNIRINFNNSKLSAIYFATFLHRLERVEDELPKYIFSLYVYLFINTVLNFHPEQGYFFI